MHIRKKNNNMKKITMLVILGFVFFSCAQKQAGSDTDAVSDTVRIGEINAMLDSLNRAAAQADFNTYFNFYADNSVFTGTDATERWNKKEFMAYAKPYFDKGKAWNFTSLERHIYFDTSRNYAWFDELLNTQMKICRGSGVLVKRDNGWKVKQYILSATIPNPIMDSVTNMKASAEDELIKKLQGH